MIKNDFLLNGSDFLTNEIILSNASGVKIFSLQEGQYRKFNAFCMKNSISISNVFRDQLEELIKISFSTNSYEGMLDFVKQKLNQSDEVLSEYGQWVYYPWRRLAMHILPQSQFHAVRTNRNREKISRKEQLKLLEKKIGIIGLSVGHSAAITLAQEAVCGELRIADFDKIELSNLNRLRTSLTNLGKPKILVTCQEILEIDPYLKIKSYTEGIQDSNIEDFILAEGKLDLIIEECDSLPVKIKIRDLAKKNQIPVVMDTSDRGMIDIERFDEEPNREILHGLLKGITAESLNNLSVNQSMEIIFKILGGLDNVSIPLRDSIKKINHELVSFPQLAAEVHLGGALVTHVARNILLNKKIKSGRYYIDLHTLIG